MVNPSPMPRTNNVPASSTSLVDEVTKANGMVAAAISRIPNGTMRRGPTRSVMLARPPHDAGGPDALRRHQQPGHPRLLPRAIW